MINRLMRVVGLDRAGVAHGLRLALSAILAFSIASVLHVQNAFWAAMPVFVVAQATRGLLIERALLRILGTVVGAGVGFFCLKSSHHLIETLALLGAWVAFTTGLVNMLRGMHGYGALLAGITAGVVVLPSLFTPDLAFDLALARAECTLIGVVCVTVITGIFTPPSHQQVFYEEVRSVARQALAVADRSLLGKDSGREELSLLRKMGDLQRRAALVTAASPAGYRRLHDLDALLIESLSAMSAARTLGRQAGERPRAAARICRSMAAVPSPDAATRPSLLAELKELDPTLAAAVAGLLRAADVFGPDPQAAPAGSFRRRAAYLAPHLDVRTAGFTALLAGGSTFSAALAGTFSGWYQGALSALGVCIFSMVLASMPHPRAVALVMLRGVIAGVAVALIYRFTLQPHITSVPGLILSVIPFLLIGSLARASRTLGPAALDGNMCFLLASQASLRPLAEPWIIFNEAAAIVLAIAIVTIAVMLLPEPLPARARNAASAIRRDLARIACGTRALASEEMKARSTRQVMRLALHLEHATDLAGTNGASFAATLELGTILTRLRTLQDTTPLTNAERTAIGEALNAIAELVKRPEQIAHDLTERAGTLPAGATASLLRDAAVALTDSRQILMSGRSHRASKSTR